jgi:hypothetical protein
MILLQAGACPLVSRPYVEAEDGSEDGQSALAKAAACSAGAAHGADGRGRNPTKSGSRAATCLITCSVS